MKTRIGPIILTLALIFFTACKSDLWSVQVQGDPFTGTGPELRQDQLTLSGRRVSELTFIVFREGMSRSKWQIVFEKTSRLSVLRTEIQRIQESNLPASQSETFTAKQTEVSEILIWLNDESSVYLLSWGEAENCRFTETLVPELRCDPLYELYGMNPMNGGLPKFTTSWAVDPPKAEWSEQSPSLTTTLEGRSERFGDFNALFRLKAQPTETDVYYKGDVRILSPSTFLLDQKIQPHFIWGYAELRLAN